MRLPPNQRPTARGKWPVVGEKAPAADALALSAEAWTLTLHGAVERPRTWTLAELARRPDVTTRSITIHCVTRWSKPEMAFTGVPLVHLLAEVGVRPEAGFLSFIARSARRHSTSLPLRDDTTEQALIAWAADGEPISTEHGGPLRNIVPDRYFYKSVKWLTEIEVLAEDRLGFWESQAGYHNGADPWTEQRYILPTLSRLQARAILAQREISGREFVGLAGSELDLAGLVAVGAKLRNADFTDTDLTGANLSEANLSNAKLVRSVLRNANLSRADLEGADLAGADLRGANLTETSLFGATVFREPEGDRLGDASNGPPPPPTDPQAAKEWVRAYVSRPDPSKERLIARADHGTVWPTNWLDVLSPVQAAMVGHLIEAAR